MGLRGPLPDSQSVRSLKGRRQALAAAALALDDASERELRERAKLLARFGRAMLARAERKAAVRTPGHGVQTPAEFRAAMEAFEAVDRITARLARFTPPAGAGEHGDGDPLEEFRRAAH